MNLFTTIAYAAEGAANATAGAAGEVSPVMSAIVSFLPLVFIILLMYFMMIRPQRKREKETKEMLRKMKVGDKVTTIGGIKGKIYAIKDNTVVIETGNIGTPNERSYIKMERDAVKSVEKKLSN